MFIIFPFCPPEIRPIYHPQGRRFIDSFYTCYKQYNDTKAIASCQPVHVFYDFGMRENIEHVRKILAGNLKKYRKKYGYSQEKLAEKAELSAQTLNDIEGCRRWISARSITNLAKALNIAEYQLLEPENGEPESSRRSSLQSLISLQNNIINTINIQFDHAKDTGDFN
jgi:transcriptional regulator with XRE-family HTH domain